MAQLWGGRFTKETDKLVYNFNASISFDQRFYEQDIQGSMAHVKMLCKQGIINEEEKEAILSGLESILNDVKNGTLEITDKYEDIHSFVEANLIDRIGDAGKKLHTARSRNDQVALDIRLYLRERIGELISLAAELAPSGIRVNCVAPGVIDTDMVQVLGQETLDMLAGEIPLGRLGRPEEIAAAIAYLACDAAYATGQVLTLDGGFVN